jgi:hypothetical protein
MAWNPSVQVDAPGLSVWPDWSLTVNLFRPDSARTTPRLFTGLLQVRILVEEFDRSPIPEPGLCVRFVRFAEGDWPTLCWTPDALIP